MEQITIRFARDNLGDILNFVAYGNRIYKISKHGKPVAVILSLKQWEEIVKTMNRVKIID